MKLNFAAKILDLNGKPMKEPVLGPDGKPTGEETVVTLKEIATRVLMASIPDEKPIDAAEKIRRFRLALTIEKGGTQEISLEDAAELKRLIGMPYGPLIVGRAYDIIDGAK